MHKLKTITPLKIHPSRIKNSVLEMIYGDGVDEIIHNKNRRIDYGRSKKFIKNRKKR